jgi:YVTN family beta-propeller protein
MRLPRRVLGAGRTVDVGDERRRRMQAHLMWRTTVLVGLGVLALLVAAGPLVKPPVARGAATVVATVPTGGNGPFHVAVNPGANLVYVTNSGSQNLSIFRGEPPYSPATPPIPVGGVPAGVAYNPNDNAVFVADSTNNVIMPYAAVPPFTPLGPPMATGNAPLWVAANPTTNRVYVADSLQPDVEVFDGTAPGFPQVGSLPQGACAAFPPGSSPAGVAVNPATNQIYVALPGANQLWAMQGGAPWDCLPPQPVALSPQGVAFNPENNHIYVANSMSNTVTIVDASTFHVLNPGLAVGVYPWGVAVNPTTNRIYVTNSSDNTVSIIDGSTDTVVETVAVGSGPEGIAANPLNDLIYVANYSDDTISVIQDMPPPAPPGREEVALQGGTCVPVASTYPDATPVAIIAGAVTPFNLLTGLWEYDGVTWLGYAPLFPQASNLTQMNRLDVVFICVAGSGPGAATFSRPLI